MELRQLRYFLAAAELENLSAVSQRLHVAQSALSRQIANLEAELGVSLFTRTGKKIRLSEAGRVLSEKVRTILDSVGDLTLSAREMTERQLQTVTIVGDILADTLAPLVAHRLRTQHPSIHIRFLEAFAAEAQTLVVNGSADIAITYKKNDAYGCVSEKLCTEQPCIYYSNNLPKLADTTTFQQALCLPLILPPGFTDERTMMEAVAADAGFHINVIAEADSFSTIRTLCTQGLGYGFILNSAVLNEKWSDTLCFSKISDLELEY